VSLEFSVVIPTYNRADGLRRCLNSLAAQLRPPPFEIIVVDDGSTDATAELLSGYRSPFPLRTYRTERAGAAGARNCGAAVAEGDHLLFVDDDVRADPELLAAHSTAQRQEEDAVIMGPMVAPGDARLSSWARWEQDVIDKQYRAMVGDQWRPTPRQFFTANASLPRLRFEESGGFDIRFKRAEDVELGYRLRRLGLRFVFRRDAIVTHHPRRTLRSWWAIPHQYGVYDIRMWRDKGVEEALEVIGREFHERHPLIQSVISASAGGALPTRALAAPAVALGVVSGGLGLFQVARWCYSLAFNLLYYQGVCDELGSVPGFRSVLRDGRLPDAAETV
jgi:GT2 family glycosyltransferase